MGGALVERARAGDADAFDELARRRVDSVYRTALGILGSPSDARDATQDALLSAWRSLPTLRDADRFDAWLHRITVNSARMVARRRRSVREVELPEVAPQLPAANGWLTPQMFDRAFERLSVEQRALLLDHHLDGHSVSDIAARLGIPSGTVKSRLHSARGALDRALREVRR